MPRSGEEIVVAQFGPVNINTDLETRNIRVLDSEYSRPDDDGDGVDNFAEIELARDPTVADTQAFEPRAGQGDCRETRLPGAEVEDEQNAERDEIGLSSDPVSVTRAPELEAGRRVYFATFLLEVAGTLTIEHQSGQPTNTNAVLYDRQEGAASDQGTANVRFDANTSTESDGVPAIIVAELAEPGLYCYFLYDEDSAIGTGEPLSDIVLGIAFTPES